MIKDLPRMTPGMLNKKLEELGTTNPTHRKAVSFLVNASKAVGLTVPAQIAKKARNKPPSPRGSSNGEAGKEKSPTPTPSGKPDSSNNGSGPETTLNLPVASRSLMLWGLFQSLPMPGTVFDDTAQEKWIKAAKAIFEVEYQPADRLFQTQQAPQSDLWCLAREVISHATHQLRDPLGLACRTVITSLSPFGGLLNHFPNETH